MKIFSVIILYLLSFYGSITAQVQDSVKFKSLPPKDFQMTYMNEDKALLVDVREYFEYRSSRLKDAVNIPSSGNLEFSSDTINKELALFLYCTSGFRSKKVAKFLCEKGFTKVYSLDGGIVAWKKEGMPVVRKKIRSRK
jgi:rhodanese-related sulfurtransferase